MNGPVYKNFNAYSATWVLPSSDYTRWYGRGTSASLGHFPRKISVTGAFSRAIHHHTTAWAKMALKQIITCKLLMNCVIFIHKTQKLIINAQIFTNAKLFIIWIRKIFWWRTPMYIYVLSDGKMSALAYGTGVTANFTTNSLVRNTKYSVCLNVACPF